MTHVTQEAQAARRNPRQGRSAAMNALMNNIFNPYTALCGRTTGQRGVAK